MVGTNDIPGNLPVLEGIKNWDRWSSRMRVLFRFQGVLDVVEKRIKAPSERATEAQMIAYIEELKIDGRALFLIHQSVDPNFFEKNKKPVQQRRLGILLQCASRVTKESRKCDFNH